MAKILIVEDTQLTFQLLYYLFKRNNHTILQACNGLEAISVLSENTVDLIITDIHMPEMDGLTMLEQIRANEQYLNLPVIVLTASGLDSVKQQALDKGATAYVSQPFSSVELGRLVTDCLMEHQREETTI